MARDWEQAFRTWSRPCSDTEAEKQANAERMIRDAISTYAPLSGRTIKVIVQGSYRNNTNVRQDSDVDICVCCMDPFFYDFHFADYGTAEATVVGASYSYPTFKSDVQAALEQKFGKRGVRRGDKAFDVHENTYRVDADVVAAFAHRRYLKREAGLYGFLSTAEQYVKPPGTQFYSDSGKEIRNWPEQHYANGVAKNSATRGRFKAIARGLKSMNYEMQDAGVPAAKPMASYLIECLVYNSPDSAFANESLRWNARECLVHLYTATETDAACKEWGEVNEMKYLFHAAQPWTRAQVQAWLLAAWNYGEFA